MKRERRDTVKGINNFTDSIIDNRVSDKLDIIQWRV